MTGLAAFPGADTAAGQFRLAVFAAVLRMAELHPQAPDLEDRLPFVRDYRAEAARLGGTEQIPAAAVWIRALGGAVAAAPGLPFGRLAAAGLGAQARLLLASIAAVEEDPNLAWLVEPDGGFPTLGGMTALWRHDGTGDAAQQVRDGLLDMADAGLVEVAGRDTMRSDWRLRVSAAVLDALAGQVPRLEGARCEPAEALPAAGTWIPPGEGLVGPAALGALLAADPRRLVRLRGPGANGRRLLLQAAARAAGLGTVTVGPEIVADPARWQSAATVAFLSGAMLLAEVEPAPGETVRLPDQRLFAGPIGIVLGRTGAVEGPAGLPLLALEQGLPDREARMRQWKAHGLGRLSPHLAGMALTLGHIARAAAGARTQAELAWRQGQPNRQDVRAAVRALRDARLDALATPIDLVREPEALFLDRQEQQEFDALLLRARHREQLARELGGGRGVRALFAGPSGTGKSLAARHVAARLGKDLYRIDLSATVNKYIGETEKALDRALSAAEELDVVLLLDEGDALMARRTDIASSNDRYANLETNFLLQRIESFDGVILVTTNEVDRIDQAFSRRLDAVITFRPPDEEIRLAILVSQLGPHRVSARLLHEVACRCQLAGGQLRNVTQHARLLALDVGRQPDDAMLRAAVEREFRKAGASCPLKPALAAVN